MRRPRCAGAIAVLMAALLWAAAAGAAEQFPTGPNHRGVSSFEPYLVFPENRPGNGVYLDNQLIFESKDLTIVAVHALPVAGRFAYYALDAQGQGTMGAFVRPKEGKPRIVQVTPGFYHLVVSLDGQVYKKLYRIFEHTMLDLLPSAKTADGPVAGPVGVVFYHVASNIRETEDGQTKRAFGLKLHLALFEDERTRHLDYLITNDRPELQIAWLDDTRIEVSLADGRKQTVSLSQFQ